jgi:hypothetical protein
VVPADNLIFNGSFAGPLAHNWADWNATATNVGGMLTIIRNPGTPSGGDFQWNQYRVSTGNTFECSFQAGNSSAVLKTINMLGTRSKLGGFVQLLDNAAGSAPLQTYTMRSGNLECPTSFVGGVAMRPNTN